MENMKVLSTRRGKNLHIFPSGSSAEFGFSSSSPPVAHLTAGHSEHLVEGRDGGPLVELHQVVQTAVAPVLADDDALSVVGRVDHEVAAAVLGAAGGDTLGSRPGVGLGSRTVKTAVTGRTGCSRSCSR